MAKSSGKNKNKWLKGSIQEVRGFDVFRMIADLSDEGCKHIDDILLLTYQYLNMLKHMEPVAWFNDELNNMGKITVASMEKFNPIDFVSFATKSMHTFTMERVLSGHYFRTRFDPSLVKSIYKMRVTVISNEFEGKTNAVERWYGTEYKTIKMSDAQLDRLRNAGLNKCAFKLPQPNSFIPSDLSLIKPNPAEMTRHPRIIHSTPISRLWYKEDTKFRLPKVVLFIEMRNPLVRLGFVKANMCSLFVDLLVDALNEYSYAAQLADLSYEIESTKYGIGIKLSGFNDKMNVLLEKLFHAMASFRIDPQRFRAVKEKVAF